MSALPKNVKCAPPNSSQLNHTQMPNRKRVKASSVNAGSVVLRFGLHANDRSTGFSFVSLLLHRRSRSGSTRALPHRPHSLCPPCFSCSGNSALPAGPTYNFHPPTCNKQMESQNNRNTPAATNLEDRPRSPASSALMDPRGRVLPRVPCFAVRLPVITTNLVGDDVRSLTLRCSLFALSPIRGFKFSIPNFQFPPSNVRRLGRGGP